MLSIHPGEYNFNWLEVSHIEYDTLLCKSSSNIAAQLVSKISQPFFIQCLVKGVINPCFLQKKISWFCHKMEGNTTKTRPYEMLDKTHFLQRTLHKKSQIHTEDRQQISQFTKWKEVLVKESKGPQQWGYKTSAFIYAWQWVKNILSIKSFSKFTPCGCNKEN